jgi:bacillopeptidase F
VLTSGDDVLASSAVAEGKRGCLLKGIEPGTYSVVASASGYASETQSVTVPEGGEAEVSFELRKLSGDDYKALGRIVGYAANAADEPIAGTTLVLITGGAIVGSAKPVGEKGVYELEWYPPGTYAVVATAPGYKRVVFTGQSIVAGESTRLDIELQPE